MVLATRRLGVRRFCGCGGGLAGLASLENASFGSPAFGCPTDLLMKPGPSRPSLPRYMEILWGQFDLIGKRFDARTIMGAMHVNDQAAQRPLLRGTHVDVGPIGVSSRSGYQAIFADWLQAPKVAGRAKVAGRGSGRT